MCVKILLICWFAKYILASLPCSLRIGVKILLIRWFTKKFLARPCFFWPDVRQIPVDLLIGQKHPCEKSLLSTYRCLNLVDLLIRQKFFCKAKFLWPDVRQIPVDLLICQKYPCESSLQSTYRCLNLVDSLIRQKVFCKAKIFLTRCVSKSCWSVDLPTISLRVFLSVYI